VSVLLRGELLKLRTTRTFVALVGAALLLSLVVVILTTLLGDNFSRKDVHDLFTFDFTSLFILLLGVIGMAGEWRHRTITGTFLAAPDRLRLLGAKLLSYAVAGAVLSLIVTLTMMAVGTLILALRDQTTIGVTDLLDVLWRNLLVAGLLGGFGVCVGGLVRNQIVAIVGLLILAFVLEPAILGLVPSVGRFGPTVGAPNGIIGNNPVDDSELLAPGYALLAMLGWLTAGFTATAALLHGRDLV
jgi:ABC-type transport system involved in multi-copper enzyme maturation permease subunit